MKKISFLILLILSSNSLLSQNGWQLIYTGIFAGIPVYKDIHFLDNQIGYLQTEIDIRKTTNAAQTWNTIFSRHYNNSIKCYFILNANNIWILENNIVNYSTNGGINWQIIDTTISLPRSVTFLNQTTGWVCGNNGMIKKTTNGGYNWFSLSSGISENLTTISFYDVNKGICAGEWGKILYTANGGLSWSIFNDPYVSFFYYSKYIDQQTAIIGGAGINLYRTSNSGLNWNVSYINAPNISSVNFNQSGRGFAFGSPADIFTTFNNGLNWVRMNPNGLNSFVNGASIMPNGTIWVAADSSMILNSTNNGNEWNEIVRNYITYENLNSVKFINNFTGFSCGNNGVLIKSTNGGINWNHTGFNETAVLKDIEFTGGNTGYVCGWNFLAMGLIYKTTDLGLSWINQFRDSAQLNTINFINSQTGWAGGKNGKFLKTNNGGTNWVTTVFQDTAINKILFLNINTGFICSRKIFKTTNSGSTWYQVSNMPATHIQFTGNTVFAISRSNNVNFFNKSTDMGETWSSMSLGNGTNPSFYFANAETGWLSNGSYIRRTSNGGANWINQPYNEQGTAILNMHFTDTEHGWVVGNYGFIMRTVSGGIGITQVSSQIPEKVFLLQNYPNPFNPVTKIKFDIPASVVTSHRVVSLRVYDILGKEMALLVNEELKPGTYEIEWDASNFPSGVYFYSLVANNFTQTKKMVVLK